MRAILLTAAIGLTILFVLQPDPPLWIITTDSAAAAGIYWRRTEAPRRGALVLACLIPPATQLALERGYLRGGSCPAGVEPVAKIVGALPGDTVDIEPQWVAVNGVRYPNSATAGRDSAGRSLPHVSWGTRRVGAREVWLFGFNNPRSFDARYFGAMPISNVLGNLEAITTW